MASQEERRSPIEKIEERQSTESKENKADELISEEEKFKRRHPQFNRKGAVPSLLQKRLNKGMKFFDSGDYYMAKDKEVKQHAKDDDKKKVPFPTAPEDHTMLKESTGETIATPDNVPMRKSSVNIQPTGIHPAGPIMRISQS